MVDLRQHFEEMRSEQLAQLLKEDYAGRQKLTTQTLLLISSILAERTPCKPDAREAYRRFVRYYLPKE